MPNGTLKGFVWSSMNWILCMFLCLKTNYFYLWVFYKTDFLLPHFYEVSRVLLWMGHVPFKWRIIWNYAYSPFKQYQKIICNIIKIKSMRMKSFAIIYNCNKYSFAIKTIPIKSQLQLSLINESVYMYPAWVYTGVHCTMFSFLMYVNCPKPFFFFPLVNTF